MKYNEQILITTNEEQKKEETKNIKEHKKHFKLKIIFIILTLIIVSLICYSRFIEPKIIITKEYKIESNKIPNSFHGLKIVQFSDIHYGTTIDLDQLNKIVDDINKLKPDLIFFTGDLFDKNIIISNEDKTNIINTLKRLNCTLYKYAIYGDEDLNYPFYEEIMDLSGFKLLNNENTLLYYEDNIPIDIIGFNCLSTNPNYTIVTNYIDNYDTTNVYKIVLTHETNSIDNFITYNPDLVLAGDTLGGLINIPFLKPLILNDNSNKYYKDYYHINNTDIYISNGLGTSKVNSRFNNYPSISLFRLYKTS